MDLVAWPAILIVDSDERKNLPCSDWNIASKVQQEMNFAGLALIGLTGGMYIPQSYWPDRPLHRTQPLQPTNLAGKSDRIEWARARAEILLTDIIVFGSDNSFIAIPHLILSFLRNGGHPIWLSARRKMQVRDGLIPRLPLDRLLQE